MEVKYGGIGCRRNLCNDKIIFELRIFADLKLKFITNSWGSTRNVNKMTLFEMHAWFKLG